MDLPQAFLQQMKELLGEEYPAFAKSYEEERLYGLRVNTSKISPEEFLKIAPFHLQRIPWIENGFYYSGTERPARDPYYYAGLYYLQEPSAMTPANVLPVEPGQRVLDLCAAPGGKSTELAVKLKGSGVLFSNDISNSRAKALLKNLELFGITNAVILSETPERIADRFPQYFDRILIDAPCSGEGMFRKDPAVIRSWLEHGNAFFVKLQKEITAQAVRMLAPGGMLLYSTCTFSPLEDEQIASWILSLDPELSIVRPEWYEGFDHGRPEWGDGNAQLKNCVRIWPHRMKGEGHFLALFRKAGSELDFTEERRTGFCPEDHRISSRPESTEKRRTDFRPEDHRVSSCPESQNMQSSREKSPVQAAGTRPVLSGNEKGRSSGIRREMSSGSGKNPSDRLPEEFRTFWESLNVPWDPSRIVLREDRIQLEPCGTEALSGLRVLRSGLLLGECRKMRFEPGQALAMALSPGQFENCVCFDHADPRVIRYLKGETIEADRDLKGLQLVCADGYPLGFAKASGTTLKNRYLAGWRWM